MKIPQRLLLLAHYASFGILTPVLSLLLMDKGCSLSQLAVVLGLYSLTVFALELPSGILADLLGRKTVFLLSLLFYAISSLGMLFLSGFWEMLPLTMLWGAGKAFSSGSADALLIDEQLEKFGPECLPRMTLELSLLETVGISIGSLLGGVLPIFSKSLMAGLGRYSLNLLTRCLFSLLAGALAVMFLKQTDGRQKRAISLKQHIVQSARLVKGTLLLPLLAGVFLSGIFLFSLETYWQPALRAMLINADSLWLFGVLSFGCFCFAALGNLLAKRMMGTSDKLVQKYSIFRLALFCALLLLTFVHSALGFGIAYCAVYFAFGSANLYESTIVNRESPSEMRASLLSLVSFFMQAGCMAAPILSGFVVSRYGIRMLWGTVGIASLLGSLLIGRVLARKQEAQRVPQPALPH